MALDTNVDNGNETGATLRIPASTDNPILEMRITRRGLLRVLPFAALAQAGTVLAGFNLGGFLERNASLSRPRVVISESVIDAAKPGDILAYPDGVYFGGLFANSTYSEPNRKSKLFRGVLGFSIFPDNAINNHDASGDPIVIVRGFDESNYYRIPMGTQTQAVRNDFGNQEYVYINVAKSDPLYKIVNGHGDNKVAK